MFLIAVGTTACNAASIGDEQTPARDTVVLQSHSPESAVPDTGYAAQFASARILYSRSSYDSAWTAFDVARGSAIQNNDVAGEADALTWMGLTAWRQARYDVAREHGERALQIKLRHGLRDELSRSYNALGLLAHDEGRYDHAIERFSQAAVAATEVGNDFERAKALANQGLSYAQVGQLDKARAGFEAFRAAAAARGDHRTEANQLINLGMLDIRIGQPQESLGKLDSARKLSQKEGHAIGEENALAQFGTAMNALGDPQRAIAYLDSALVVDSVYELQKEAAENLQLKAEIFGQLGDHARALELLNRANDIATALSQRNKMADIARFKSHQYLELGDGLRAERLAIDALRLHGFAGAQLDAVSDMMLLAELALRSGRSAHAQSWVHTANAVARQLDLAVARGEVALTEARIASHLGNSARVLSVLEKNQLDIAALGAATRWEAHALRARAFAGMDQLEAAEREGRLAVATIEKTRQLITSGPLQTSYTVSRVSAYADLVTTLLRMQRLAEALEVADAARGRALLEQLSARSTQVPGEAAQQIVESERLLQRIDWLVRQLQVTNEVPKRDRARRSSPAVSIQRELADAQRRYELLLRGATRVGSSDATMLASPIGVLRANAVQKSLDRTEALLEYFVADAAVVGFVVTADTIVSFTVGVSATELADRVHLAGKLLRDASTRAIDQKLVLRRLHQLLLEPAIASGMLRTMETLIVVPHGALVHLPFVALVDSRNRYVGEQFDVITSPSASIFAVVRGRSRSAGPGPHAVFAPLPDQLPGTREEATAVAARLRSANTFVGGRATETEMRKQLAAGGHVHIATHGTLASASPMFSHIETAADSTKGSRSDGRLEVHEVLGMSVRSELVFLSGCETGAALAFANAFRRGEDYATLSQAFLFAGAGNVIATLWRIDDAGAAAFASTFYDALQSSGPSAALATAQRAMMRHPRWSSPRYWAGYTLSGTGRAVSFAKSPGASVTSMNAGSPTPQRQLQ